MGVGVGSGVGSGVGGVGYGVGRGVGCGVGDGVGGVGEGVGAVPHLDMVMVFRKLQGLFVSTLPGYSHVLHPPAALVKQRPPDREIDESQEASRGHTAKPSSAFHLLQSFILFAAQVSMCLKAPHDV